MTCGTPPRTGARSSGHRPGVGSSCTGHPTPPGGQCRLCAGLQGNRLHSVSQPGNRPPERCLCPLRRQPRHWTGRAGSPEAPTWEGWCPPGDSGVRAPAPGRLVLAWFPCWPCHTLGCDWGASLPLGGSDSSSVRGLITALPHRVFGRSQWRTVRNVLGPGSARSGAR